MPVESGGTYTVDADRPLPDTLGELGVDLPDRYRYGGCNTCPTQLIAGHVDRSEQVALNNRPINNGYVVLCAARSLSHCALEVGVDSRHTLCHNPFLDPLHAIGYDILPVSPNQR